MSRQMSGASQEVKCASSAEPRAWTRDELDHARKWVGKLQRRIAKAQKEKKYNKVKALQHLLVTSKAAKKLAVERVTSNKGKRTAGVDGVTWQTNAAKAQAIGSLKRRGYKPKPLKRVYIPKKGGAARLSISWRAPRQEEAARHPDHEGQGDASPIPNGLGTDSRDDSRQELLRLPKISGLSGRD